MENKAEDKTEGHNFKRILNKLSGQPSSYARKAQYTFGKTLGAGSFGIVRYARRDSDGEEVAVKIILKKALKGHEQVVLDELELLKSLQHPYIVGFRDWFESKDKYYLVTQLATGGELFDRIIERGHFTESDASKVVIQMLEALRYLHGRNIVHRDIKPENILYLTHEPDSNVVLADFGIAKKLENPSEKLTSSAGSFGYAAPEVILGVGHGTPCDIWSLGVVTYTLLCGYSPFRSENVHDFIEEVRDNKAVVFHADYWKDVSRDARRFIVKTLQFNPSKRPDAETLLQDPWIVSVASEHQHCNLVPNLKQGFNARRKFRQAIEVVKLNNRIKKLKEMQTSEDDDPNEINLFGDSSAEHKNSKAAGGSSLESWSSLKDTLTSISRENSKKSNDSEGSKKSSDGSSLRSDAFFQLVQTATQNKERVKGYKEE
ncbi:Piso0_004042 [Millerozyma farinosa CBS 7064]|uniref:calcium/calmodulin-dependent protein kinase n=1 Tax=Pichia sorbitophila (strain ATCC MYA-4447 / BCRC 22081 / CBS 7064 / NBRC 10061 / NRRL Y-12695) TaxID=559304 RepID=G8YA83_PICSO|nr:Piso0_004042 [Millerozyma farinosa CBS 7064]CCE84497.1 Piso0_004042 [Millerozyma farinosa CBS 7064]